MQSYQQADAELTGRCKQRRKVANNTWLERRGDDIAVRLHGTDVVTFHPDGSITLDTGGWFTVTTKERMNSFSPFGISSVKGEWQVSRQNPEWPAGDSYWVDTVPYRDGMTWLGDHWDGIPTEDEVKDERARRRKLRAEIKTFVKGITPDEIVESFTNAGGDCIICGIGGDDCLYSHVTEPHFHLTLARRALEDRNFGNPDFVLQMIYGAATRGRVDRLLTDSLTKFLVKRLVTGVAVAR